MAGKAKTIGAWVISVLLAVLFLIAGVSKLLGATAHIEHFAHWGVPRLVPHRRRRHRSDFGRAVARSKDGGIRSGRHHDHHVGRDLHPSVPSRGRGCTGPLYDRAPDSRESGRVCEKPPRACGGVSVCYGGFV